ncbi:hypothetical protein CKY28_17900 [Sphingomonas lenta]|uniref:Right handed beta helix domain-containing protein n=2 Tax=Sphingomonas lenta TaxID=1141887 RepID=A0A2A2SBF3_9SPHN|nr:hypothetical protein CKY28_17900 [Sphingomonas lenta]
MAQSAPRTVSDRKVSTYSWIDALPAKGSRRYQDFTARRIIADCSHNCVRIQDGSERVTIEDSVFSYKGPRRKIVAGVSLVAGDVTLRNVTAQGFVQSAKYPNGDGVMAARRTRLTVIGGAYRDNSDAGIDSKGETLLENVVSERNGLNYRCWGDWTAGTLVSRKPVKGHFQTNPGCVARIRHLLVEDDRPGTIFGLAKGTTLIVDRCTIRMPTGGRLIYWHPGASTANTTVRLGPGCKAP